jgi:hypothetical protein
MTLAIRSKVDVTHHRDGYGSTGSPAVNVKVHNWIDDVTLPSVEYDERYTHEWINAHLSERQQQAWWDAALESGWEMLQDDAEEIWGTGVKVYSEGRCGGWATIHGIPDFETWDAIELGRWRKFARWARATADAIPEQTVSLIYINVFEPAAEASAQLADARDWRTAVHLNNQTMGL